MERFEKKIKNEMKESDNLSYPDFDKMWSDIQQDELKTNGGKPVVIVPRRRKRFALIAGLTVALLATPVYGALTYDWSNILSFREGIQTVLDQGLGQAI
ncbi:MAG: RNA polymerase subunit sigma, partial [Solibacillus sp.]